MSTRARRSPCWVGLAVVVACGCGGAHGTAGDTGPFDAFARQLWQKSCALFVECRLTSADAVLLRWSYGTVDRCAAATEAQATDDLRALRRGLTDGTLHFDPVAAQRCLDAVDRMTAACVTDVSDPPAVFADCPEVVDGAVPIGGSCGADTECEGDAFCDRSAALDFCGGRCTARRASGASCGGANECSVGDSDLVGCAGVCIQSVIAAAPAAVGQSCGPAAPIGGSPWIRGVVGCGQGPWCDATCRLPIGAHQPCLASSDVCADGYACAADAGGSTRSCRPLVHATQQGTVCGADILTYCDASAGLVCSDGAGGSCEVVGDGSAGARCDPSGATACDDGLQCDPTTAECALLEPLHAPCANDRECESGRCAFDAAAGRNTCRIPFCSG